MLIRLLIMIAVLITVSSKYVTKNSQEINKNIDQYNFYLNFKNNQHEKQPRHRKRQLIVRPLEFSVDNIPRKKQIYKDQLNLVVVPNLNQLQNHLYRDSIPPDENNFKQRLFTQPLAADNIPAIMTKKPLAKKNTFIEIITSSYDFLKLQNASFQPIVKSIETTPKNDILTKNGSTNNNSFTSKLATNIKLNISRPTSYAQQKSYNYLADGTYIYTDESDKWLVDFESKDEEEDSLKGELQNFLKEQYDPEIQLESLQGLVTFKHNDESKCPPPPSSLFPETDDVTPCTSDQQCRGENNKCCYNGKMYICMLTVKPAPYLDWLKQPKSRQIAGNSWLLPVPQHSDEQLCTTSEFLYPDEDPLLCPHGFTCLVKDENSGNKAVPDMENLKKNDIMDIIKNNKQRNFDENINSYKHSDIIHSTSTDIIKKIKIGVCVPGF